MAEEKLVASNKRARHDYFIDEVFEAGIVLTGGRSPAPPLLQAAKRANLPLLLVKQDTFPALERLEQSTSHLSPGDVVKVRHILELMAHEGALERLLESLKPPRA